MLQYNLLTLISVSLRVILELDIYTYRYCPTAWVKGFVRSRTDLLRKLQEIRRIFELGQTFKGFKKQKDRTGIIIVTASGKAITPSLTARRQRQAKR